MKRAWLIGGVVLLLFGVVWAISIMGGVFSQSEGFTQLGNLWPGMLFHVLCMAGGMVMISRATTRAAAR